MSIAQDTIQLTLKPLEPKHVATAAQCIASTFSKSEPMSEALAISEEEFIYFSQIVTQKAASDQLSVVVVTDEDEVVGALICEDYTSPPPAGLEQASEKFEPIAALLEVLGKRFNQEHEVTPGSHLHMSMCGIYPQYVRQRLAQRLIQFAEDMGRRKGYKATVCEATGSISQHMMENSLNYIYADEIVYKTFQYEGQAIFKNIDSVSSCKVYHKPI
ncbi:GNAT family N-acetyltransferase [Tunicatimonas pelagia]|uniref:GNAT family N-acetyltransferase n=1 Tax=Tunicatimonas pelagia TaxID=931531 RepID=UPI0026653451|nr:GNAT family N-acetyltransferase [Tunicatimonas pelagia]WKN45720.1 hypothetical protein P0M28_12205 [Tunicatimonas pelagia]